MISIEPGVTHSVEDRQLVALVKELIGSRLNGVRYALASESEWPADRRVDLTCHEVDMAVELVFESATLVASWATPGSAEGLQIELMEQVSSMTSLTVVDMDQSNEWRPILGDAVAGIGVSFYSYDGRSEVRPWALRLNFACGDVVIALGEDSLGLIRYMPDNLVVIFGDKRAKEYIVADGVQSAWGTTIPLVD